MCWGFSALSAVETNAAKNGNSLFNFSEAHLAYSVLGKSYTDTNGLNGRYNYDTSGGQITYAPTYFFGDYGQKLESEMPFLNNLNNKLDDVKTINSLSYTKGNNIISVESFYLDNVSNEYGVCSNDEISKIKSRIMENGSVQATMYMDQDLFDNIEQHYISKVSSTALPNHGVVIVGWDDTISKSKFNGATRDGAWIIKNSWGSNWSGDGLFYISYDDDFICNVIATFSGVSTKTFDYTYQSSDVIGSDNLIISGTYYIASNYSKKSNKIEGLERVSFPVDKDLEYKVYLANNKTDDKSTWTLLGSGVADTYGITSINIADVNVYSDFTIIVEYSTAKYKQARLMVMRNLSFDTAHLDISEDNNFVTNNLSSWRDMYEDEAEPVLYAYTSEIVDKIVPKNDTLSINSNIITVTIGKNQILTYKSLIDSLDVNSSTLLVNNATGTLTNDDASSIGTGSTITTDNASYKVIIKGDPNGDGKISALDYIAIRKHMIKTDLITDSNKFLASDMNGDGKISALDYIAIRKIMIG